MNLRARLRIGLLVAFACMLSNRCLNAQVAPVVGDESVQLTFNGNVEMRTFIDLVSKQLGINFLVDEKIDQLKFSLNAPEKLQKENLLPLLQSALRANGYAIVDSDVPNFKRIIPAQNMLEFTGPNILQPGETPSTAGPVTRIFILENADPRTVETTIKPFLSRSGGATASNTIVIESSRSLIISDFPANLQRIERLIEIIDKPKSSAEMEFIPIKHISATELAKRISELSVARKRAMGRDEKDPSGLEAIADERSNQLILMGNPELVREFKKLASSFDKPLNTTTKSYVLRFATSEQVSKYLEKIRDSMPIPPPYTVKTEGNTLIINTTNEMHQQVKILIDRLDTQQTAPESSPIRFYRMKNVPVEDILQTLQSMSGDRMGDNGPGGSRRGGPGGGRSGDWNDNRGMSDSRDGNRGAVPGPNQPYWNGQNSQNGSTGQFMPPQPPAYRGADRGDSMQGQQGVGFLEEIGRLVNSYGNEPRGVLPGPAQVSADANTNTLIIVAEPEVQKVYQTLIEALDRRPPQVMIEAKIIVIDTTDDYSLGVEISGGDRADPTKMFAFTSYGLSTVDPKNGNLTALPSLGLNGVLVDPKTADLMVKALAAHKRARVLSAPRLLVNDNAEGELSSVSEVPFTSVNASQTVATTSFAGFAKAGTTINVKPTISQDDYLQLDYVITLNSFTGAGSTGVPPPRQTNEVQSKVSVPDGYTIIVGGLNQLNRSNNVNGLPYIENIPLVRNFLNQKTSQNRQSSLFVFLRPAILRDDKFRDLRFLSNRDLTHSGEYPDYPQSEPIEME